MMIMSHSVGTKSVTHLILKLPNLSFLYKKKTKNNRNVQQKDLDDIKVKYKGYVRITRDKAWKKKSRTVKTKKTKALKIVRNKNTAKELSEKLKKRIYTLRKEILLKTPVKNDIEKARDKASKTLQLKQQ